MPQKPQQNSDLDLSGIRMVFVDADDTLWENNHFFLQSLEWLHTVGRRLGRTDRAVTTILNSWERRNIPILGFSYDSYETSLLLAIRQLAQGSWEGAHLHPGIRQQALRWTHFLRRHPILFMPGVSETIPLLAGAYPTIIVTKGDPGDQMAKVRRSGLLSTIRGAEVLPRKSPQEYRAILEKYGLGPDEALMIGNSPASDINNAKRAGIRTVFVPHPRTWSFEMEPILPESPPTIEVPHFGALRELLRLS